MWSRSPGTTSLGPLVDHLPCYLRGPLGPRGSSQDVASQRPIGRPSGALHPAGLWSQGRSFQGIDRRRPYLPILSLSFQNLCPFAWTKLQLGLLDLGEQPSHLQTKAGKRLQRPWQAVDQPSRCGAPGSGVPGETSSRLSFNRLGAPSRSLRPDWSTELGDPFDLEKHMQ